MTLWRRAVRTPSLWAIIVLVIVVLVLFGARRLPDVAASVGKSLKIFKSEIKDLTADDDAPAAAPTASQTPGSHATVARGEHRTP
ncbi:Sec-independent protein translocase subunit TatA [Georgenia sp. 311]|nr:Sec-independent protein translocase subunit TatA [Georgenia sp. 311]